jgi:hypothetical protein
MTIQTATPTLVVTVSNTSLFQVAADHLGDATQWDRIAKANPSVVNGMTASGFVDPWIAGTVTLIIPQKRSVSNGGAFK